MKKKHEKTPAASEYNQREGWEKGKADGRKEERRKGRLPGDECGLHCVFTRLTFVPNLRRSVRRYVWDAVQKMVFFMAI